METQIKHAIKEISKCGDNYVHRMEIYRADNADSIFLYDRNQKAFVFFCKQNGRSIKRSIAENYISNLYND